MITSKELAEAFGRNVDILVRQTNGLSHAESVLQPPMRGNCMNWVLGHIADNRDTVLQQLGQAPLMSADQRKRYGYGSEPVCVDGDDLLKLEQLLSMLQRSQTAIASVLEGISPAELAKEVESFYGKSSLGSFLFFLCWHETYHLGQTEVLRQLAGTNDKVI